MATLNENPLINNNSDNVPSIVSAHNKNLSSVFNVDDNRWKIDNTFLFDGNWDIDDKEMKMNDSKQDGVECELKDDFTPSEIFEMIRSINDPEHPLTLEQLAVVQLEDIKIDEQNKNKILINFTPTIPHCSMATLIGLSIRVKLLRSLPDRFKVKIKITPNTHQSEKEINKQLNDKERVAAALENYALIKTVNQCIKTSLA